MSKYVVIECEDDDTADALIERIKGKTSMRIAGVYQRPNTWCRCPFQIAGENRPVFRGKKYGWWICGWCHKPRPGTHNLENRSNAPDIGFNSRRYYYGLEHLAIYEMPNPAYEE